MKPEERPFQYRSEDLSVAEISPGDIWRGDALNRKKTAELYDRLISGQDGPMSICLNVEWGGGKTFFLRRFAAQYEKNGGRAIYFNAWEDDELADPLIATIGQLWQSLKASARETLAKDLAEKGLPSLQAIGLRVIKAVPYVGAVVADNDKRTLQSGMQNAFDEYLQGVESKKSLKRVLSVLTKRMFAETGKPLLFIVDELDRCRPTFAVELLERVKHLLNVPHLIFLFGADCEQLGHCVQSVYGEIDAKDYLLRFFDIEMRLPKVNVSRFFETIWDAANYANRVSVAKQDQGAFYSLTTFRDNFSTLLECNGFSLRQIERALRIYEMLAFSDRPKLASWTWLNAILIVLRMKHVEEYRRFVAGTLGPAELIDALFSGAPADWNVIERGGELMRAILDSFIQGSFGSELGLKLRKEVELINKSESLPAQLKYLPKCLRRYRDTDIRFFYGLVENSPFRRSGQFHSIGHMALKIDEMLDCMECSRSE